MVFLKKKKKNLTMITEKSLFPGGVWMAGWIPNVKSHKLGKAQQYKGGICWMLGSIWPCCIHLSILYVFIFVAMGTFSPTPSRLILQVNITKSVWTIIRTVCSTIWCFTSKKEEIKIKNNNKIKNKQARVSLYKTTSDH